MSTIKQQLDQALAANAKMGGEFALLTVETYRQRARIAELEADVAVLSNEVRVQIDSRHAAEAERDLIQSACNDISDQLRDAAIREKKVEAERDKLKAALVEIRDTDGFRNHDGKWVSGFWSITARAALSDSSGE